MSTGTRILDALRPTMPDTGAVARSLLAALAMAGIALVWDSGVTAVWVLGAATIAGAVALQDSPGGRIMLVIVVSLQMSAAVFVGALTASHDVVFVIVVAIWCFAAGLQWAVGSNAGLVGAAASALLVLAPPVAPTLESVVVPTVLTLIAGGLQAALIVVRPPRRWRTQRDALTQAYRTLAETARRISDDRGAPVAVTLTPELRDVFVDTQASRRPEAYQGGHRLPERIMVTLRAMARASDGDSDGVPRTLSAAAEVLDAIADHSHTARREAEHSLVRLEAAVAMLTGPQQVAAERLTHQLCEAAELRFPDLYRPDLVSPLRGAATTAKAHLTLTSPILRHAVRLSAAVAAGVAADRFAPVNHGHWIALTVLMVLRPETAHTYTRCVGRLAGIAGGVALASLIAVLLHPAGLVAAVLAALILFAAHAVSEIGYIAVAAAVAAATVFLLDVTTATSGATLEDRLFSVVIGGGFAVVAHVVLPDHALTRLHQRAGELLKTEIDYAAAVVKAYVHELDRPADALAAAWQRAYRARSGFEAASGATRMESPELRRWLRSYRTALNAVTSACTTLESSLPNHPPASLTPEFVAAVDDYVDALRGAPPTPATPWTVDMAALTAATQQVRERATGLPARNVAARVLVSEIGAITRSLSGIGATHEPTSAQ
ncbi:FUSC family protein [Mycobacterium sp. IDR2000157661]|uniref:FUSC family protein n=1 Tax=Mycobacterium sp. IDR2000157661 TaxID=2867005 RepID=UPI001EE9E6AE|nr:FUSC family protein [Mycobacterium sp. IDR2000157661]